MEFVVTFRWDYFIAALGVLFAFGLWYNRWVEEQMEGGHDRGYMGLIVALGCFVTLVLGLLGSTLNVYVFAIALGAFAASGIPMIRGSIQRFNRVRAERRMEEMAEETKRQILAEGRRRLSTREQALLEGVMSGLLECKSGFQLASETLMQMYDPLFARDSGNGEDEDLVDGILWAIAEKIKGMEEK